MGRPDKDEIEPTRKSFPSVDEIVEDIYQLAVKGLDDQPKGARGLTLRARPTQEPAASTV